MSIKNKNIFASYLILSVIIIPFFVLAAAEGGDSGSGEGGDSGAGKINITITNPFKQNTIQDLIKTIVNDILMPIGAVVAALMVMYAGFMYVTAGGDPGKIKKAHDALLWTVVGAAILLGAWVISQAIQSTINQLKV